MNYKRQ